MAKKIRQLKTDTDLDNNNTGTELRILKSIEKAWYRNNPEAMRRNTLKSLDWFRKYIPKNYHKMRLPQVFADKQMWVKKPRVGQLYFYHYDAIHKDTLPVWDRYPMIFPFEIFKNEKNGHTYLLGINLHYLPPKLRFEAMRSLLTLRNEKRFRKNTKLRISWQVLKGMSKHKLFEHSVKMYRMDHIKTSFCKIPAQSWEMAIYLPLARWENGSKELAWKI